MNLDTRLPARVVRNEAIDPGSGLCLLRLDATPSVAAAGQYVKVWTGEQGDVAGGSVRYVSLASPPGAPAELLLMPSSQEGGDDPAQLQPGATLAISAASAGKLTLQDVPDRPVLWLLAAGTGLAPLRAILASGVPERFGRVVLVHAVQRAVRLAFAEEFAALQAAGRLRYMPMLSRQEREGTLHGRIPAAIDDGRLEQACGVALDPDASAVLICGSGAMVADTRAALLRRGFDQPPEARVVVSEW